MVKNGENDLARFRFALVESGERPRSPDLKGQALSSPSCRIKLAEPHIPAKFEPKMTPDLRNREYRGET